jgi:hypothetical protein
VELGQDDWLEKVIEISQKFKSLILAGDTCSQCMIEEKVCRIVLINDVLAEPNLPDHETILTFTCNQCKLGGLDHVKIYSNLSGMLAKGSANVIN